MVLKGTNPKNPFVCNAGSRSDLRKLKGNALSILTVHLPRFRVPLRAAWPQLLPFWPPPMHFEGSVRQLYRALLVLTSQLPSQPSQLE